MSALTTPSPSHRGDGALGRGALIAAGAALLLGCAGCASGEGSSSLPTLPTSPTATADEPVATDAGTPPAPGVSAAAIAFWHPATKTVVEEVSPAGSLTELADRSTLVVRGPVTRAAERGPTGWRASLTVQPREVLKGAADAPVRVDVHHLVGRTQSGEETAVPTEDYLWFLVSGEEPGVWHPVTVAGVVGPGSAGPLTTVLQPTDSVVVVPAGTGTLDGAVARAGLAGR